MTSEPMDTSPAPAPCPPVVKRGRGGDHRSALRGKAATINLSLQQQDGAGKDTTRILMAPDIAAALKVAVAAPPPNLASASALPTPARPPHARTQACIEYDCHDAAMPRAILSGGVC